MGFGSLFLRTDDMFPPILCLDELVPVDGPQIENDGSPVNFPSLNAVFFT